jgi:hypothetical protein
LGKRREPEIIIPCSYGEIFKVFLNNGVFIDKRLYECYTKQPMIIAALLNCSLTFFFAEIGSRTGLGEGLLDLTVYEVSDWLIVNPKIFSESKVIEIEEAFEKISRRNVQPVDQEAKNQNRNLFDELILQSIDLDKPEIQEIYYELIRMVSNRLDRANTF